MILAKEFEGELWVKAADHNREVNRLIAAEREACAKVCDAIAISARKKYKETYNPYEDGRADGAWECEEAIRARGRSEALTNLNKAAEDMGQEL